MGVPEWWAVALHLSPTPETVLSEVLETMYPVGVVGKVVENGSQVASWQHAARSCVYASYVLPQTSTSQACKCRPPVEPSVK